jgi:hypothetical protein
MSLPEALTYIDEKYGDLSGKEVFAWRAVRSPQRTSRFAKSHHWVDGRRTGKKLAGTSAVLAATWLLDQAEKNWPHVAQYGNHRYLIKGTLVGRGDDDFSSEVIVGGHRIIAEVV